MPPLFPLVPLPSPEAPDVHEDAEKRTNNLPSDVLSDVVFEYMIKSHPLLSLHGDKIIASGLTKEDIHASTIAELEEYAYGLLGVNKLSARKFGQCLKMLVSAEQNQ